VRDTWNFYFNRRPELYGPLVEDTVPVTLPVTAGAVPA